MSNRKVEHRDRESFLDAILSLEPNLVFTKNASCAGPPFHSFGFVHDNTAHIAWLSMSKVYDEGDSVFGPHYVNNLEEHTGARLVSGSVKYLSEDKITVRQFAKETQESEDSLGGIRGIRPQDTYRAWRELTDTIDPAEEGVRHQTIMPSMGVVAILHGNQLYEVSYRTAKKVADELRRPVHTKPMDLRPIQQYLNQ